MLHKSTSPAREYKWVVALVLLRRSTATTRRSWPTAVREQSVMHVSRRTETGEAPGWQGATSENTGSI